MQIPKGFSLERPRSSHAHFYKGDLSRRSFIGRITAGAAVITSPLWRPMLLNAAASDPTPIPQTVAPGLPAVRGEQLKLEEEAPAVHRHRPAMDLEDGGWTLALSLHRLRGRARVGAGPDDPAMNLPAIRPLEGELLWAGQPNLAKE